MKHLNRHILCAVAIKTTGPNAQKHEMLEIAVIPLTATCDISKEILPFNILFQPEQIERAEYSLDNDLVLKCISQGQDRFEAAELFEAWLEKLKLPRGKKIMVLAHNWVDKKAFLKEWLQPTGYDHAFHNEYRDPQVIGLFLNDHADVKNEPCPFPKVKLSYMAAMQKIEYENRLPTVIDECQVTIDLYKNLLRSSF